MKEQVNKESDFAASFQQESTGTTEATACSVLAQPHRVRLQALPSGPQGGTGCHTVVSVPPPTCQITGHLSIAPSLFSEIHREYQHRDTLQTSTLNGPRCPPLGSCQVTRSAAQPHHPILPQAGEALGTVFLPTPRHTHTLPWGGKEVWTDPALTLGPCVTLETDALSHLGPQFPHL